VSISLRGFSRGGVVSTSPNPQAGEPPLVGCTRLLIQFIRSYPPYRRPFLHPQPEDTPCRGDRDPLITWWNIILQIKIILGLYINTPFQICRPLAPVFGAHGGAVGWGTALQAGRLRFRYHIVLNLPTATWPWVWLCLWQKWVPGISSGGKGLTTLPTSCAELSSNSVILKLLEL
jgi:hypothetical protein